MHTMLPTAEQIRAQESKPKPLPVEPWVAANLSRLWQSMKTNIQASIASGMQAQPRSDQSAPASARNRS
jgi:hypothetical protein